MGPLEPYHYTKSLSLLFHYEELCEEIDLCACDSGGDLSNYTFSNRSRDSAVSIATGYGLNDRGITVRVPVWSRIYSFARRPDWPWDPPNRLSTGYQGLFPRG
jgi:hypothetical protein